MNHSIKRSFVLALLVVSHGAVMPESLGQKSKKFFNKYKGPIIAGTVALAAAGTAIAVGASVGDKTKKALDAAHIKSSDRNYAKAVALVAFFGPLGQDKTTSLLMWMKQNGVIADDKICSVFTNDITYALETYWGVSMARKGASVLMGAISCGLTRFDKFLDSAEESIDELLMSAKASLSKWMKS